MVMQLELADVLDEFLLIRSPEMREKLVLQSVPLVHYMLGRLGVTKETERDYEDLAHEGLIGLMEAVDHFDLKFKTRFSTYACLCIRRGIIDYLRSSDWMTRAGRKRINIIQNTIGALWTEKRRGPTEDEIAARSGFDVQEVQEGLADLNCVLVSLDKMIATDKKDTGVLQDAVDDEKQADPADTFEEEAVISEVSSAIRDLPEREQLVLSLYYNEGLTLKEIGKILDITESRVCQLHAYAITLIKARIKDEQYS